MNEPVDKTVDPKPFVIKPAPGVAAKVPDPAVQVARTASTGFRRTALALLIINTGVIGYILLKDQLPGKDKKDVEKPTSEAPKVGAVKSEPVEAAKKATETAAKTAALPAFVPQTKPPATQDEQRAVLQYMLDEKRKLKPKTKQEKAKLDEEKALLKEWIRSKDVPSL